LLRSVSLRDSLLTKFVFSNSGNTPIAVGLKDIKWRWFGRTDGRVPNTALASSPISRVSVSTSVPPSKSSYLPKSTAHNIKRNVPGVKRTGVAARINSTLTPKSAVRCRDIIKEAKALESKGEPKKALGKYESARGYLGDYDVLERKIEAVKGRIVDTPVRRVRKVEGEEMEEVDGVEDVLGSVRKTGIKNGTPMRVVRGEEEEEVVGRESKCSLIAR